jgi:MoxR-like ATPase
MMEVTIDAPADDAQRASLAFDARFHDPDALVGSLTPAIVVHTELNALGALIQRRVQASDALQQYALSLWRATAEPARFGVRLSDVDTGALMLAGASPRGMSLMMRAARVAAWLDARDHVTPEDLQAVFSATMAHRLVFQPVYEMRRHDIAPQLIAALLASVAAP